MLTVAFVIGMFGGFLGVYSALLVSTWAALLISMSSLMGGRSSSLAVPYIIAALAFYTLGIIGGALALQRTGLAAILLACAAVGGAGATIAAGTETWNTLAPTSTPTPTRSLATLAPRAAPTSAPIIPPAKAPEGLFPYLALPFVAPTLLLVATGLTAASWRKTRRSSAPPEPAGQ